MNITLIHKNPTPTHCEIEVIIDGDSVGILRPKQSRIGLLNIILTEGINPKFDTFVSKGNPNFIKDGIEQMVYTEEDSNDSSRTDRETGTDA